VAFNEALLFSFLCVFVRCSAMFLTSPIFSAQSTPLQVRIFTTLAISGALTVALGPKIGPPPADMYTFVMAIVHEALAGLLIGSFMSLVLQAAQMAGTLIDTQMGLGMSQVLNPINGISSTVISQFKYMLAAVVFLCINGHHLMLQAFAQSYGDMPGLTMSHLPQMKDSLVGLFGSLSILAIQMAAPVLGVSLVVDAALGIVNKAVPQMQVMVVGLPAKIVIGMIALSVGLPAVVAGVNTGVGTALEGLMRALRGG